MNPWASYIQHLMYCSMFKPKKNGIKEWNCGRQRAEKGKKRSENCYLWQRVLFKIERFALEILVVPCLIFVCFTFVFSWLSLFYKSIYVKYTCVPIYLATSNTHSHTHTHTEHTKQIVEVEASFSFFFSVPIFFCSNQEVFNHLYT